MFNHHLRTRPACNSATSRASAEEIAEEKRKDEVRDMFADVKYGVSPFIDGLDNRLTSLASLDDSDEEEEDEDTLRLDFLAAGDQPRTVIFETSKLGMTFNNQVPLVVTRVALGSAAKALGVERGWKLLRIAGQELEGLSWEDALDKLKAAAAALPGAASAVRRMPIIKENATPSESSWSQSDRSSILHKSASSKARPDDLQSSASTPSTVMTSLTEVTLEDTLGDRPEGFRNAPQLSKDGFLGCALLSPESVLQNRATPQPALFGSQTQSNYQPPQPVLASPSCVPRPAVLGTTNLICREEKTQITKASI